MIRQMCPHCYAMNDLPDDAAGTERPCGKCGKAIAVPANYTPGVSAGGGVTPVPPADTYRVQPASPPPPAPAATGAKPMSSDPSAPPGLNLPPQPQPPSLGGVTPPPSADEHGGVGITLSPTWLVWVPLGCLVGAFFLSFFPWAKLAPAGYTVLTQNGWDSLFGWHSGTVPEIKEWKDIESSLDARLKTDIFILPYLLFLLPTLALAALERGATLLRQPLPPLLLWVPKVMPYMLYILGGLSLFLLVLLAFASLRGFGLERVPLEVARGDFDKQLAENPTGTERRKLDIQIGQTAAKYAPAQTVWVNLLLLLHVLAVVAILARLWLNTRGDRPPPRLGLTW